MTASEIQTIPESAAEGSDPMLLMTITGRVQFQFPSTNLLFAEKKKVSCESSSIWIRSGMNMHGHGAWRRPSAGGKPTETERLDSL